MASRLELHEEFSEILDSKLEQDKRAYFNPPESVRMKYPCIRYSKGEPNLKRANDAIYRNINKYEGVIIDPNPDTELPTKLLNRFRMCSLGKSYIADNLVHTPFTLYY